MERRRKPDWNRRLQEWPQATVYLAMAIMLIATAYLTVKGTASYVMSTRVKTAEEKPCVVIDAGHGGEDPGKVGINGALEKDINLQVAKKLKNFLELQDVKVIMTREEDTGLHEGKTGSKKVQDMKKRIEMIENAKPDLIVSIHQNSYPEEYVNGAQVFYYTNSKDGKKIAETLQKSLVERLDKENHREAKANDSYYLLKKTSFPIVIVECGFLSNAEEAEKLCTAAYQEKTAWAVHMGVMQYLNEKK